MLQQLVRTGLTSTGRNTQIGEVSTVIAIMVNLTREGRWYENQKAVLAPNSCENENPIIFILISGFGRGPRLSFQVEIFHQRNAQVWKS